MSKTLDEAIKELCAEIAQLDAEIVQKQQTVNTLCALENRPPLFQTSQREAIQHGAAIRSDQFYGQPLATSVRTILELRKQSGSGAATVNEIYATLMQGGFSFDAKNEDNAKRILRISLAKNTTMFHKLPNGQYGLRSWYPNLPRQRASAMRGESDDVSEGNGVPEPEEEAAVSPAADDDDLLG